MTENTHYPWDEGMPTKPDVDLLLKAYPELEPGDKIPYEEVEEKLGISRIDRRSRFVTVTNAWRKRLLEDSGIVIECSAGVGFYNEYPAKNSGGDTAADNEYEKTR